MRCSFLSLNVYFLTVTYSLYTLDNVLKIVKPLLLSLVFDFRHNTLYFSFSSKLDFSIPDFTKGIDRCDTFFPVKCYIK